MSNILTKIAADKKNEIEQLKLTGEIKESEPRVSTKSFKNKLLESGLSVIAEIKRKSPSKGELADIPEPTLLATEYVNGGTSAISVLTNSYFSGDIKDLKDVTTNIKQSDVAVLRKEFVVDKLQIDEAIQNGADAVLLIIAILGIETKDYLAYCKEKNIDALVEVHDRSELEIALDSNAEIIGINNRNLNTFEVDINNSLELKKAIPKSIVTVAESGIDSPVVAHKFYEAGFDAVLVGEMLVKSDAPQKLIQQMRDDS